MPHSTLDKSSRQHNLFGYHTWDRVDSRQSPSSAWLYSSGRPLRVNTTLSTIKAYNGYHPCHRVIWINPAANITFSVITLETDRDSYPAALLAYLFVSSPASHKLCLGKEFSSTTRQKYRHNNPDLNRKLVLLGVYSVDPDIKKRKLYNKR